MPTCQDGVENHDRVYCISRHMYRFFSDKVLDFFGEVGNMSCDHQVIPLIYLMINNFKEFLLLINWRSFLFCWFIRKQSKLGWYPEDIEECFVLMRLCVAWRKSYYIMFWEALDLLMFYGYSFFNAYVTSSSTTCC